jgi:flagellar basal-body rod protein FlgB
MAEDCRHPASLCRIRAMPTLCRPVPDRENPYFPQLARPLLFYPAPAPRGFSQQQARPQMSDAASNTSLFGIHGMALELRSQRMGLLTSNIANAATPNYRARDIDFTAALKSSIAGTGTDAAATKATLYRVPVMPSLDGNTVDLSTEQVAFSENAMGYSTSLSFISGRVNTITRALKGE